MQHGQRLDDFWTTAKIADGGASNGRAGANHSMATSKYILLPSGAQQTVDSTVATVLPFTSLARRGRSASVTRAAPEPLLPAVARGDVDAVKACVRRYGSLVHAIVRRFLRDEGDIDDACQDVFVALWRGAAAFDPARSDEGTFVAMIARRRVVDRHRTPGTRPLPMAEVSPAPTGSALEAYVDARSALSAMAECNETQRRVIVLAAVHGLTHEEIARELTLPLGTVKSHYARGIERVKRALEGREAKA